MTRESDEQHPSALPHVVRLVQTLALAGFVPFAVLTLWLAAIDAEHPWRAGTIALLVAWSALILSFLAGVRWGIAIVGAHDGGRNDIYLGMLPVLAAWAAMLAPAPYAFVILALAFAAHGAWDTLASGGGPVPQWYASLRLKMTLLVVAAMIGAFLATA